MTNNIKYRKPIPIKAQSGRSLEARQDNTRVYRPEIRQKMKAPEGYSPLLTPIDNQNQKATMPLSIALGEGAVSGSRVGPIGAAIGMGAALLDHYMPRAKGQAAMIRSVQTPRSRVMDRAETAPTDTISSNPASATQEAQETNPGTNNTDNKDNKDNKDKKSFRDRLADKVADKIRGKKSNKTDNTANNVDTPKKEPSSLSKNIKRIAYETKDNNFGEKMYPIRNLFRIGAYLTWGPEVAGHAMKAVPDYLEYAGNKFQKGFNSGKENNSQSTTSQTQSTPTKQQQVSNPDSINFPTSQQQSTNLDAIIDSLKLASQRQKSGQTQIYN